MKSYAETYTALSRTNLYAFYKKKQEDYVIIDFTALNDSVLHLFHQSTKLYICCVIHVGQSCIQEMQIAHLIFILETIRAMQESGFIKY